MMTTFLFYDLETTGINPTFDQILQFAALRTDKDFRELERYNIKVRLRPDVVPAPGAVLTTKLTVADVTANDCYSEYDAVRLMHTLVNKPDTISIGYNSLRFDDQFLRFSFYRNLLPAYTHQYAQGCGRADLLPITMMFWRNHKDALQWPEDKGKVRLKLELLSKLNKLAEGQAHDALVDVKATVALAHRLREHDPEMWEHTMKLFDRTHDRQRIAHTLPLYPQLPPYRGGMLIDIKFRCKRNYQAPVLILGHAKPYPNQVLLLRLDSPALTKVTMKNLDEAPITRKKMGDEHLLIRPEKSAPPLTEKQKDLVALNVRKLQQEPDLLDALVDHHSQHKYDDSAQIDIDATLYQSGFPSDADNKLYQAFHTATTAGKAEMLEKIPDKVRRELALRLLGRNYPEVLSATQRAQFMAYRNAIQAPAESSLPDHRGKGRRTPAEVLKEIATRQEKNTTSPKVNAFLEVWADYIRENWSDPS